MLKALLQNKKDRIALAVLTGVGIITHLPWLFTFKIFSSGDWGYVTPEKYDGFFHFSPIWFSDGLGGTSATPSFYLVRFFEGALTQLGSTFMLNEKILFLIPISFVGLFGAYLLLRQYFQALPAVVGSLVFSFNTALLFNYAGPLTIGIVNALAPLAIYMMMRFFREPKSKVLLVANALLITIMMAYELRITIIVGAIVVGYLLFKIGLAKEKLGYIRVRIVPLAALGGIIIALNAYWLIPYAVGAKTGVTFSEAFNQGLFASFSDIRNALTLYHPFWTGARPATFVVQPVALYAWILPIVAFSAFAFLQIKTERDKEILFWALLAIVGIFLVKQVNEPLVDAYPWIFKNIPGFEAYRESSKFYLVIALAYSVLIPYSIVRLRNILAAKRQTFRGIKVRTLAYAPVVAVLLVVTLNAIPLITGKIRTLYTPKDIPSDYKILDSYVNGQPEYFRTMWLPVNSRWAPDSINHPRLSAASSGQGSWVEQVTKKDLRPGATLRDKAIATVSSSTSPQLLSAMSVKYVIIPSRDIASEDDFYKYYGDDRQYYIDTASRLGYLKQIDIGMKDVLIYENTGYKGQFSASANLQSYTRNTGLNPVANQSLSSILLKQDTAFRVEDTKTKPSAAPATSIVDIASDLQPNALMASGLGQKVALNPQSTVVQNNASRPIVYRISQGVLSFFAAAVKAPTLDGQAVEGFGRPEEPLGGAVLDATDYYLNVGKKVVALDKADTKADSVAGRAGETIAVYGAQGRSEIKNASFESGLWSDKVEDCNDYNDSPAISLNSSDEHTDGKKSLILGSLYHTACTTSNVVDVKSRTYLLQFDHMATATTQAGYRVNYVDGSGKHIEQRLPSTTRWSTHRAIITVPDNVRQISVTLIGYPNYQLKTKAYTNYDAVKLVPLTTAKAVQYAQPAQYQEVAVSDNAKTFMQAYDADDNKELVQNSGFDKGLWQQKVFDCNAFDDRPDIAMSLGKQEANAFVELKARRHAACTSYRDAPVSQNRNYLFSMRFQSPNAASATYSVTFNDPDKTTIQESVPVKGKDWTTYAKQMRAPLGATSASITLYANGNDRGTVAYVNRYDDISLRSIPLAADQYYMVARSANTGPLPQVKAGNLSLPTKKYVQIHNAKTPFYLNYSATYNPLWRLELDNAHTRGLKGMLPSGAANAVDKANHYRLDDFMNGWYVDPVKLCQGMPDGCARNADGSYDIRLVAEFTSQRWFYAGALVSVVTLLGLAGLLGVGITKRLRQARQAKRPAVYRAPKK